MTVFFFVLGLEIRREMHSGQLTRFAVPPSDSAVGPGCDRRRRFHSCDCCVRLSRPGSVGIRPSWARHVDHFRHADPWRSFAFGKRRSSAPGLSWDYSGGIHRTLTGVIVGLMTPVRASYGPDPRSDRGYRPLASIKWHTRSQ